MNARERLARARLYLCTDARDGGADLESFLDAVLGAGVDVVQLREKAMDGREQVRVAGIFRRACDQHGALFVVNDRADLALAAGADGVHLGQDDLDPGFARSLVGPGVLIGRSTHTRSQIVRAGSEPVDYIAVGPVHETPTKPGRPATGLSLVEDAARDARVPWFAIGGLNTETLPAVLGAGARRAVVVRALTLAEDPALATKSLRAMLDATQP